MLQDTISMALEYCMFALLASMSAIITAAPTVPVNFAIILRICKFLAPQRTIDARQPYLMCCRTEVGLN